MREFGTAHMALLTDLGGRDTRNDTGLRGVGVVAQELAAVVPEAVLAHDDGLLSVAYGNLVGVLIEAVKDLAGKVERLEGRT